MSTQSPQSPSLDEFLVVVNGRDLDGTFIVPKPDVAARLTQEIEQRTGLKSRNMAGESGVETSQHWVSAQPGQFITQTRAAVDAVSTLLRQNAARSFEVTFHNTEDKLNWGDRVLLAVRYDNAA